MYFMMYTDEGFVQKPYVFVNNRSCIQSTNKTKQNIVHFKNEGDIKLIISVQYFISILIASMHRFVYINRI